MWREGPPLECQHLTHEVGSLTWRRYVHMYRVSHARTHARTHTHTQPTTEAHKVVQTPKSGTHSRPMLTLHMYGCLQLLQEPQLSTHLRAALPCVRPRSRRLVPINLSLPSTRCLVYRTARLSSGRSDARLDRRTHQHMSHMAWQPIYKLSTKLQATESHDPTGPT